MSLGPFRLLDETTAVANRVTVVEDDYGDITETLTPFTCSNVWYEPLTGREQFTLPEGYRDIDVLKMYTSTSISPNQEGTNRRADRINVDWNGEQFTADVILVRRWSNGTFLNHFQAVIVRTHDR